MNMLPDIDAGDYQEFSLERARDEINRRVQQFNAQSLVDNAVADLGRIGAWAQAVDSTPEVVDRSPTPAPEAVASPEPATAPSSPPVARGAAFSPVSSPASPGLQVVGSGGTGVTQLAPTPAPAPTPQPTVAEGLARAGVAQAAAAQPSAQLGGPLQDYARAAASRAGVDPDVFVRQIQQESGFNPNARSPAGAQGVAQIVPQYHPGVDPSDPYASLDYAARLMKSNLTRYGGDYATALAAYNAGPGAVERYGGVPPFEETQRYVNTILGGQTRTAPTPSEGLARAGGWAGTGEVSQFGDKQLTNQEAYAACGPAAAVRFAQKFGRNPTLREAVDLARTVGWSEGQGMAGLGSEKALMDKMGVPTRQVGADWSAIAKEAQTGNPVTISTPGHYFTADGYDPASGRFHVGRSGLDLKGGSEWMTPGEMQGLMGGLQGALFADNPQVATQSSAGGFDPIGLLEQAKESVQKQVQQGLQVIGGSTDQQAASTGVTNLAGLDGAIQQVGSRPEAVPGGGYDPSNLRPATAPAEGVPLRPIDVPPSATDTLGEAGQRLGTGASRMLRGPLLVSDQEYLNEAGGPAYVQQVQEDALRRGFRVPDEQEIAMMLRAKATGLAAAGTEAPGFSRMYHGTGRAFEAPNAANFDPNGLYGPGYYLTSDPRVAGGIVAKGGEVMQPTAEELRLGAGWPAPAHAGEVLEEGYAQAAGSSPNVRAVDVPQNLNLLAIEDTTTALSPAQVQQIYRALPVSPQVANGAIQDARMFERGGFLPHRVTPSRVYADVVGATGSRAAANTALAQAGFDGISHVGGQRVPMYDSAGAPIEHDVNVIFPESLDKLRNATSGRMGGEAQLGYAAGLGAATAGAGALWAANQPQVAGVQSEQSTWDKLGSGIADVFKNVFGGGGDQPVNAPGGGYDPSSLRAVTEPSQSDLPLRQDVRDLGQEAQPTIFDQLGEHFGPEGQAQRRQWLDDIRTNPEAAAQAQALGHLPEDFPTDRPVPTVFEREDAVNQTLSRLLRGPMMLRDQELLDEKGGAAYVQQVQADAAARGEHVPDEGEIADMLRAQAVGLALAGTKTGFGGGAVFPWRSKGASEGLIRALEVPGNQSTRAMLDAPLPTPEDMPSWTNRFVRAWTNRFEGVDRYMEDALKSANMDPTRPPDDLDLKAMIREMATDGSVKVAEDRFVKPAIRLLGGDETARKVLSSYLIHRNTVDVAAALGEPYRDFPGGGSLMQSQQALREMEASMSPEEWQTLQAAGQHVYDLVGDLRTRMRDSGLIDKQTYEMWNGQYPHWVPTRILDFLEEGGGPKVGSKLSLGDNGVRHYTQEGTTRFQEDPLASLLGWTAQVERMARKNEAVSAVLDLDKLGGTTRVYDPATGGYRDIGTRILETDAPVKQGETVIQHLDDGTVRRYVAPKDVAEIINSSQIDMAPGFVRNWVNFQRGVMTIFNPAFALLRNPSLDVPTYFTRQLAREGGDVRQLPRLTAKLIAGYQDALAGLKSGEFQGEGAQQFLQGGGSGSTLVNTAEERAKQIRNLAEGTPITDASQIGGLVRRMMDPIARAAERVDMGPRIAAMRLAEERGASPRRAILEGRNVTMDFNEGGNWAKTVNSFIPFFNVGPQDIAQVQRMVAENPKGAAMATAMTIGLPQVMAEAWNRSDAQRSKDYDDIPNSIKRQGPIIMSPFEAPVDKDGNRHPQFWQVQLGARAGFGLLARQAAEEVMANTGLGEGAKPSDWADLLKDIAYTAAPVRATTAGDVPRQLLPEFIPGMNTGAQLAMDRDFYRGTQIATKRHDEDATQAAREIADAMTKVGRVIDPNVEVHPSQVDFAAKDFLGSWGEMALGSRAFLPGAEERAGNEPQKVPVLGGVLRALNVRGDIGEQGRLARENILTDSAHRYLQGEGVDYVPSPIDAKLEGVPLRRDEETRYQQLANRYTDDTLQQMKQNNELAGLRPDEKLDMVQQRVRLARERAALDVKQSIPRDDWYRRLDLERERERKALAR